MPLIVVECKINCPGIAVSANCLVQSDCQRNVIGLDKKQTWGWAQLAVDQAFFGLISFLSDPSPIIGNACHSLTKGSPPFRKVQFF